VVKVHHRCFQNSGHVRAEVKRRSPEFRHMNFKRIMCLSVKETILIKSLNGGGSVNLLIGGVKKSSCKILRVGLRSGFHIIRHAMLADYHPTKDLVLKNRFTSDD
jgi:hypothetical protein